MESYVQIEELTKSYGDRLLFADVTFGICQGDKIGLIARNGTGKSTMLRIICGKEEADSGSVIFRNGLRTGFLDQNPEFNPDSDVLSSSLEFCEKQDSEYGETDWNAPDRARQLLTQFGLTDHSQLTATLSGGQRKRLALIRVLLAQPDLLILDEPTNHLDVEMIEWLENYLTRQRVTILMVTHDRYFLDNICNKIIEIDRNQIFTYNGNYDYYLTRRAERMEALGAELAKVRNLLRTEQEWMRRQPQARGSKAKYRIDNFHELKSRSQINLNEQDVKLNVKSSRIGSKIFEAQSVSKSFGDKVILKGWNYVFTPKDKVGIVGPNGIGKSTFIKMLLGKIQPDSGNFDIGTTIRWGYYSQDGLTGLNENMKVIDAVREIAEEVYLDDKTRLSASQFLNQFLFSVADQQKYISKLSGGEMRRLYLATVLMRQPNFLILDEPTNDLDIMTLAVLEEYLSNFRGCVLVVSHDRFFLDRIADHLFVFTGNGEIKDFPGDYSTWRHCMLQREKELKAQQATTQACEKSNPKPRTEQKRKLTFNEKREMEQLEIKLEKLNLERDELESKLCSGTISHDEIATSAKRIQDVISQIDEAELRLLELMEIE